MKERFYSFIGWILVIAAIFAITFLSAPLLDRLFLPWAFEHNDRPALTGRWVGSLTTATGRPRGVVFELRLPEPKGEDGLVRDWRSAPYGELEGIARVCDERGQVRAYTLEGEPENRQATRLSLYASPSETPTPEGLTFSWILGTWDRANQLDLTVQFYWEKDGASISGGGYPETLADSALTMTRGGDAEFQAICAGLPHSN
jgi:hypothetical protein